MLFMKDVDSYEVMPWPERTFLSTSFTPGLNDVAEEKTPKDMILEINKEENFKHKMEVFYNQTAEMIEDFSNDALIFVR